MSEWSDWDVEETFQLRMLLEPYASFLAATRGGEGLSDELEVSNQRMEAGIAADPEGIGEVQSATGIFTARWSRPRARRARRLCWRP